MLRAMRRARDPHSVFAFRAMLVALAISAVLIGLPEFIGYSLLGVTNWRETCPQLLFTKYLVFPILGCAIAAGAISATASKRTFAAVNALLLFIALVRLGLLREYNVAFSPVFFANLDFHTVGLAVRMFPAECLGGVLTVGAAYLWCRLAFDPVPILSSRTIRRCVCVLAFVSLARGALSWPKQLKQVPAVSLVFETTRYYFQSNVLAKLPWTVPEISAIADLGMDYRRGAPIAIAPQNAKNVIIVYLEGLDTELTGAGGSKVRGITPNLDRFASENTFLPNFFASTAPSLNAFVSSQCGILAEYASEQFDRNAGLPPNALCLPQILAASNYQRMFLLGAELQFSGFDHLVAYLQYEQAYGRDELYQRFPELANTGHRLGLYDSQVFDIAVREIDRFDKSRPFLLSIFTFDTHPPYYNSPDCTAEIRGTPLEESLNCQDQAVGTFLAKLDERGLTENTVVIMLGDHLQHATSVRTKVGRTYFAFSHPGAEVPGVIEYAAHLPDVVPTVFELLGSDRRTFYAGKSIVSTRKDYQHLVTPVFEYKNGQYRTNPNRCSSDELMTTTFGGGKADFMSQCELRKLFLFQRKALS